MSYDNFTYRKAWEMAMRTLVSVIDDPTVSSELRVEAAQSIIDFGVSMAGSSVPLAVMNLPIPDGGLEL